MSLRLYCPESCIQDLLTTYFLRANEMNELMNEKSPLYAYRAYWRQQTPERDRASCWHGTNISPRPRRPLTRWQSFVGQIGRWAGELWHSARRISTFPTPATHKYAPDSRTDRQTERERERGSNCQWFSCQVLWKTHNYYWYYYYSKPICLTVINCV